MRLKCVLMSIVSEHRVDSVTRNFAHATHWDTRMGASMMIRTLICSHFGFLYVLREILIANLTFFGALLYVLSQAGFCFNTLTPMNIIYVHSDKFLGTWIKDLRK